jgi:hypothetical protein
MNDRSGPTRAEEWPGYRLVPEFTAPAGKYDWQNKAIFIETLVEVLAAMVLGRGESEKDHPDTGASRDVARGSSPHRQRNGRGGPRRIPSRRATTYLLISVWIARLRFVTQRL